MDRIFTLDSLDKNSKKGKSCIRATPWWALLTAALFLGGLACFIAGGIQAWQYTNQVLQAVGVAPSVTNAVRSGLLTAVLVVGISGAGTILLVVLLGMWRLAQKSMLGGGCCSSSFGDPSPGAFTAYRASSSIMTFLVWLLLFAVVAILMIMLLWVGGAIAINTAITSGRRTADSAGVNLNQASDLSAAVQSFLGPQGNGLVQQLLGGQAGSVSPICPPVCLNLGSFAMFLQSSSCVCGSDSLIAVETAAREGTRVGIISLVGAGAMYIATTVLLMILTAHNVEAKFDRFTAKKMRRQRKEDYESGFAADPKDCIEEQEPPVPVVTAASPTLQYVDNQGASSPPPWHVLGGEQYQLQQVAQRYKNQVQPSYPGVQL